MKRTICYVVTYQGQWYINFKDRRYGPYSSQAAAIKAARDAAHASARAKIDTQVLVQGADNKFRAEWTYSLDPYPPIG